MKILLLAGSGESRILAEKLSNEGHEVLASLAGVTREVRRYATPTRTGGFGGDAGFRYYLKTEQPDLVIDATHPFAARISKRSVAICSKVGIPYVQLLRPEWHPKEGANWTMIGSPKEARDHVKPGSTVFLATGRQTLMDFGNLSDCHLICRQIDPPDEPFPFPNGEFLVGRPPFSIDDEISLFKRLGVDVLVVKNAGGAASRSKLDAARALGILILMIKRPAPTSAETLSNIDDVMAWVAAFADH